MEMLFDKMKEIIHHLNSQLSSVSKDVSELDTLTAKAAQLIEHSNASTQGVSPFVVGLTVFVLAVFVGYYVVWKVTPALHSPLMAVTNAISSVIIVGALLACGLPFFGFAKILGFLGVVLAAINIFGGFIVTQRMLQMFMKKKNK
jgi:NAD(P) transhydrogenase subunit alpha